MSEGLPVMMMALRRGWVPRSIKDNLPPESLPKEEVSVLIVPRPLEKPGSQVFHAQRSISRTPEIRDKNPPSQDKLCHKLRLFLQCRPVKLLGPGTDLGVRLYCIVLRASCYACLYQPSRISVLHLVPCPKPLPLAYPTTLSCPRISVCP